MAQRNSAAPNFSHTRSSNGTQDISLADETAPRKPSEYWLAIVATVSVIALGEWVFGNKFGLYDSTSPGDVSVELVLPQVEAEPSSSGFLKILAGELNKQWPEDNLKQSSNDLLLRASDAVVQQNHYVLADSMRLLGVNALREEDMDSAGVYLDEALNVFEELEDDIGIASVELLRGELNLKRRAQARRAAYAYDALRLARWKVAHGQFQEAISELNSVVDENLALNRFGAAAAAYQTLYKGYSQDGQLYEAQEAGIEIVKLHSSAGRPLQAQAMLATLEANGLDLQTGLALKQSILTLQQEYENSVMQMARARDYQQLYNHFIHAGDPVRAWQFRVKAQQSLRGVTSRAMHRRQTGVLALLYTSNDYMKNAELSLDRASQLFSENDQQNLVDVSERMLEKVF